MPNMPKRNGDYTPGGSRMRETTRIRTLISQFIETHECYDGQICVCTKTFRRDLMIPIISAMKGLENRADE